MTPPTGGIITALSLNSAIDEKSEENECIKVVINDEDNNKKDVID